ncbi:MAG: tetratricopeptide repeat protein [Planctomycetota bacterium]|jgi:tetratricopeptide (TPR) repeat protein|nr:tetratricopeptide repeat protein [Planctomycetota bacterium]MDA1200212.1 tetratricopeptide repeat protein [Planctomycetota bacterium]
MTTARAGWRSAALFVMAMAWTTGGGMASAGPQQEDPAIRRIYADAVHAYFSGDYQRAYDDLTEAIAAGAGDPRAWYFRGLAALEMGRSDEAEADFEMAADMEATAVGDWPVARSLERIQGHKRLALERHRIRARVARLEELKVTRQRRLSAFRGLQDTVVRPVLPESERMTAPEAMGGEEVEELPADRVSEPSE